MIHKLRVVHQEKDTDGDVGAAELEGGFMPQDATEAAIRCSLLPNKDIPAPHLLYHTIDADK